MLILDNMVATGADVLSLDSAAAGVDLVKAMERVPEDVCVLGNINPTGTILTGDSSEVEKEVSNLLELMQPYPNFILSTGCDLPLDTSIENIAAFMKAGRRR